MKRTMRLMMKLSTFKIYWFLRTELYFILFVGLILLDRELQFCEHVTFFGFFRAQGLI